MADFVPLTSPPLANDPQIEAAGIGAMPSNVGDVFDNALGANPTPMVFRALKRSFAQTGIDPVSGAQVMEPEASVPAADLNERYGIPARPDGSGGLTFQNDLPDSVAKSLYDAKRNELMRESVAQRRPSGFLSGAATLGAEFAAGALDPLNIAAAFIPVVGEARYATWLEGAGSALGRAGIRAGVGATQGAVGTAPIALAQYGLGKQESSDQTAVDALLNIAFGGILGGGLHVGAGAIADVLHGPFRSAPARVASGADRVADAPLNVREASLRTAVAQVLEGRPVEVTPIYSGDVLGGSTRTLADLQAEDAAMLRQPASDPALNRDLQILRGEAAQPQTGPTILTALRQAGPVKDAGGELQALGLGPKEAPGLVSAKGKSLDDVTLKLWEDGWLPEFSTRPTIQDLLSVLYDQQHGSPRYHPSDAASNEYAQSLRALDEHLYNQGIDLRSMSNAEVEQALKGGDLSRRPATLADHAAQDAAYRQVTGERFATAARYAGGEALPEDAAVSRVADTAVKVSAEPDKQLAAVNAEIAQLEDQMKAGIASGELTASDLSEYEVAAAGVARADAQRAGFQQAAACLAKSGA